MIGWPCHKPRGQAMGMGLLHRRVAGLAVVATTAHPDQVYFVNDDSNTLNALR